MTPSHVAGPASPPPPAPSTPGERLVELRQYRLHPGARERLIELFEREFIDSQQACGIEVLGQFRDLDRPDHFVWLRGFSTMELRQQALAQFYGGPVWKAHRETANATMLDSDDVLLLRPIHADSGFADSRLDLPVRKRVRSKVRVTLCSLPSLPDAALLAALCQVQQSVDASTGARALGGFMTDSSANTFPALPVREGEQMLVWFSGFDVAEAIESDRRSGAAADLFREAVEAQLGLRLDAAIQTLRLAPTERSQIR